jgi:hypothetical protein
VLERVGEGAAGPAHRQPAARERERRAP